jgi:hypothetical protein
MIAAGRPQASVYIMPQEPPALQVPAPAPAADANADGDDDDGDGDGDDDDNAAADGSAAAEAAAAAEEAAAAAAEAAADEHQQWLADNPPYQQLQLLGDTVLPTDSTPVQLSAVRVRIMELRRQLRPGFGGAVVVDDEAMPVLMEGKPLFFAVPPRKPAPHGDRLQPLMFLARTNAYWFQMRQTWLLVRQLESRPVELALAHGISGWSMAQTAVVLPVRPDAEHHYQVTCVGTTNPLETCVRIMRMLLPAQ